MSQEGQKEPRCCHNAALELWLRGCAAVMGNARHGGRSMTARFPPAGTAELAEVDAVASGRLAQHFDCVRNHHV
jgi:hypothetical protein